MSVGPNREDVGLSWRFVWYSFIAVTVLAGISFVSLSLKPTWLGLEREAYKSSYQYTEGKESMLLTLIDQYNDLATQKAKYEAGENNEKITSGLQAQMDAILSRIKSEASRVPPEAIDDYIRRFVATH